MRCENATRARHFQSIGPNGIREAQDFAKSPIPSRFVGILKLSMKAPVRIVLTSLLAISVDEPDTVSVPRPSPEAKNA